MFKVLFVLATTFASANAFAGGCGGTSNIPEIVPCPPTPYVNTFPKCDPNIPVHFIRGEMFYWNEFMAEEDRPCQLEFQYFMARVTSEENLNTCEVLSCDPVTGTGCVHDVLIYPYWVDRITTAKHIAGQRDCSRRRFEAEGCFVAGSEGRIFVTTRLGYDRTPVVR